MAGYFDSVKAGNLEDGAHDFVHIHEFFRRSRLTLVNMTPDDALAGDDPARFKCIHDRENFLVYLANPTGNTPQSDDESGVTPSVMLRLPGGRFHEQWYDPGSGLFVNRGTVEGGERSFTAPGPGDWVLWLERRNA